MGLGILGWQILILVTIVAAGRSRGIAVILWVIWTAVQVFALPLSLLQFGTIWLGHTIAAALFPSRPDVSAKTPAALPQRELRPVETPKHGSAGGEGKAIAAMASPPTSHKGGLEGRRKKDKSLASSPMPSVSARAKVDLLARGQHEEGLGGMPRRVPEETSRSAKAPQSGGQSSSDGDQEVDQSRDEFVRLFLASQQRLERAVERAPTQFGDLKAIRLKSAKDSGEEAPALGDLSGSLIAYLESLEDSSDSDVGEAHHEAGIQTAAQRRESRRTSSANQNVVVRDSPPEGMCDACDEKAESTVADVRYCSVCGAFKGMTS